MSPPNHEILNQRFMSRIIDSMADGVFTMDNSGKITSWNRSMEKISGYGAAEALGQTCALLGCSQCFGQRCPAGIGKCKIFEKETSGAKECQLQHKQGHEVPVIKHASVVKDDDGLVLGVVETVTDISELNRARRKAEEASRKLGEIHRLDHIIGKSQAMYKVFSQVRLAAASDATVLIQGESGTGKELIAGAIHFNSDRKNNALATVSCSALPENLLESELFGHVKGAFTGAIRSRIGRFEEAGGGTLFLDEIGELSPFIQIKLLRVLQEREIERIGESTKRKINIRIVTATHQDLRSLVKAGKFREDLYYRLNVFPVRVPPLRERTDDIPLLVSHFIHLLNQRTGKRVVDASRQVMRLFMDYLWPGNVRELENAMEHAFVLCNHDRIEMEDLPRHLRHQQPPVSNEPTTSGNANRAKRRKVTKSQLLALLDDCDWNKAQVARRIGVSHTSVWKYMKKWDIPLKRYH